MNVRRIAAGLVVGATGIALGCAPVHAAYDHAAFEAAMESANKNMRAAVAALIAADWAKVGASAAALAADGKEIRGLTPKDGKVESFRADADSLAARAQRLALAAKAGKAEAAARLAGETLASCAGCHQSFRK